MNTFDSKLVPPVSYADAAASVRHVFIRDMVLNALIGVHKHEQKQRQRVRINLDLSVFEKAGPANDRLADVVDYEEVADGIRALVGRRHVNLLETLAEQIAELCLAHKRVRAVRVRVEKLDVFADAASAGVEIERFGGT